jgi:hypothetical protein
MGAPMDAQNDRTPSSATRPIFKASASPLPFTTATLAVFQPVAASLKALKAVPVVKDELPEEAFARDLNAFSASTLVASCFVQSRIVWATFTDVRL